MGGWGGNWKEGKRWKFLIKRKKLKNPKDGNTLRSLSSHEIGDTDSSFSRNSETKTIMPKKTTITEIEF